jgi:signal transduction histidine kinase
MESTKPRLSGNGAIPLLTVNLAHEVDVVMARQRARQLARLLGFETQDQIRLATATSEIARNAIQYAANGRVDFSVDLEDSARLFLIDVTDQGPGIPNVQAILDGRYQSRTGLGIGLAGTQRMMDWFALESMPGTGTSVSFGKSLPSGKVAAGDIARIREDLAREWPKDPYEEVRHQNREALAALELLRGKESELRQREEELRHLNQELEATNRGVVALYAELDERAEALRAANEVKTHFLSHMSHEFRTPLNSILALTALLTRRTDGELTPDQEKQVGYIRRAAEELFEMVNDLLDLAKVEAGKVELKQTIVHVGNLFGVLRGLLRPLSSSEAVHLVIDDAPSSLLLRTDEGKLAQILRNLVSNALKFTERGEIRVSVKTNSNQITFEVSDTGIGIALRDQQRIFEDFAQVDNPIQRKVKGTGLGLPLSRKLAELLGGSLNVQSTLGVGSTFSLALPRGLTVIDEAAGAAGDRGGASILVIDDEEVARYMARQMFRGTDYRVIEAAGGSEGAERARFEKPSLIILDLTMPGMNGFEVLDELKADPATQSIPVIIHTSLMLSPSDLARLGNRQAAILQKGTMGLEQATAVVHRVLGDNEFVPPANRHLMS